MNKIKHVIAIFIVLGILATAAYFLPKTEFGANILQTKPEEKEVIADTTTAVQDTLPFKERFQNYLEMVQYKAPRKKNNEVWTLGKGRTIIYYLLQAQRFLDANGGKVLYMEELNDENQSAKLEALDNNGDTLKVTLEISDNIFRDNASYLTVGFQVTKLTPEMIVALNELDFPYDLLINPFYVSDNFFPDLDRIKNKELALWILMESQSLDSRHNRLRPIRIHHTEQQIEKIITDAKMLVPNAKGIATRFADQAVEHKQLLQATLQPAKNNNLWFADLSMNQKSKVMETCREMSIKCMEISPYNPSNSALDDYIKKKLKSASKSGKEAMVLPLSEGNVAKLKSLKEKATSQGTTIVNLSTFMQY